MKTLIVYDSVYGNTEKIARAIGAAITGEVNLLHINKVNFSELKTFDLLIIGSPTQGGRPTGAIQEFIAKIPYDAITGINIAVFDTRLSKKFVGIFGYAAGKIEQSVKKNSGTIIASPEGFFVKGTKGPLVDGEIERATGWAKGLVKQITK